MNGADKRVGGDVAGELPKGAHAVGECTAGAQEPETATTATGPSRLRDTPAPESSRSPVSAVSSLISEAEKLLEGVTPGPWENDEGSLFRVDGGCVEGLDIERDYDFAAAARSLVPRLLEALRESERRYQEVSGRLTEDSLYAALRDCRDAVECWPSDIGKLAGALRSVLAGKQVGQ